MKVNNVSTVFYLPRPRRMFVMTVMVAGCAIALLLSGYDIKQVLKTVVFRLESMVYDIQYAWTYRLPEQTTPANSVLTNGPLRVNPANPRYFMDANGKLVFLAGAHFWDNLQESGSPNQLPYPLDYSKWLDFLQAHNHNFFRLWTWEQAKWVAESTADYYFVPTIYVRTGPGTALDGKPKFDLTKLNQAYFDRMRQRIIQAGNRGMYVSVMLFNGWSVDPKVPWGGGQNLPWKGHPFNINNNINQINGDPNGDNSGIETEDLSIPAVTALQDAYVRKVVDTVNDLDNVLYEICNECASGSWQSSDSTQWQYHMIDLIHAYEAGKPKQHPVGISVISLDDTNLFASNADWITIHDSGSLDSPYVADGSKVVAVDTDHICGICGDRVWVWKSFTRGKNLLFMDQYDDSYKLNGGGYIQNNPNDVSLRLNLGYTRIFANRINLAAMTPTDDLGLCSTGYCLRNPAAQGAEYLVYRPASSGDITVDLSAVSSSKLLKVEWFNPANGSTSSGASVNGGASRSFTSPFSGDAVLYIFDADFTPVEAFIGASSLGSYNIPSKPVSRITFASISSGPVKIVGKDNVFGSERVLYKVGGVNTSFSETMGLPANQLDNTYWLPWYDNKDLDTQLRIGNTSNSTATIHISIGGQPVTGSPFTLGVGKSVRKSFVDIKKGPVKIVSNVPIVAGERVIYKVNGIPTSFSEMMAFPASQLDTTYWLPWYNNKDLTTQLWIANVSNATATLSVRVGGTTSSPFTLAAGAVRRLSFPGMDKGPVKIQSNQKIVVAERVIYRVNGSPVSLSESMALPNSQLNTTYWLPWYNSKDLDSQLRFANVTDMPASVHVYIGGQEMAGSPFTLAPGASTRRSFANINTGPVEIVSNVNIVAAERVIYKVNGIPASFSELMALPANQLDSTFWFPWYNNKDLNTELFLGAPK